VSDEKKEPTTAEEERSHQRWVLELMMKLNGVIADMEDAVRKEYILGLPDWLLLMSSALSFLLGRFDHRMGETGIDLERVKKILDSARLRGHESEAKNGQGVTVSEDLIRKLEEAGATVVRLTPENAEVFMAQLAEAKRKQVNGEEPVSITPDEVERLHSELERQKKTVH
jgi:integrase